MLALDRQTQIDLYTTMLTIRRFEERVALEFYAGNLVGFVHSYIGQEAIAAGVCRHLSDADRIVSHHRGHGHCIAKGADMNKMMAEVYGKKTGYCKGKGGSMHIAAMKTTPIRVCAPDIPIPFSPPMERYAIPDKAKIVEAVKGALGSAAMPPAKTP
jgi:TPP-dependent pyruvate/acetoin dehydrogenase alpha subunit